MHRFASAPQPTTGWARRRSVAATVLGVALACAALPDAIAAEAAYPFEGTWILPQHACTAGSAHLRNYTAREVTSPRGRCSIRRIAQGAGAYELLEDCRHDGRPSTVTETIRITAPDSMLLKRQEVRLKIARQVHYVRCNVAAATTPPTAPTRPAGRAFSTPTPADAQRHTP